MDSASYRSQTNLFFPSAHMHFAKSPPVPNEGVLSQALFPGSGPEAKAPTLLVSFTTD